MNKYAYITLATSDWYIIYASYLQMSLKVVKSQYPLIVMITENVKDSKYLSLIDNYIIIPYHTFPNKTLVKRYENTINKFYMFNLTEYDKLIYLDSDLVLFQNVDNLFELNVNFVCSTYERISDFSGAISPLNGFIVLTPNPEIYQKVLEASTKDSLLVDDESVIYYLLYPKQFQELKWDKECATFEFLGIKYSAPVFFHAKRWQLESAKKNISPKVLEMNCKDGEDLLRFLIDYHYKKMNDHLGVVFSRECLMQYFTSRGSLKHFDSKK